MKVFTKLGLVLLAFFVSAGVLVAQSSAVEHGPKSVKQINIPQTDDLFDLQFTYPVGVGGGEAGIETNGNYIYTSMWNGTGDFQQYSTDGTWLGTIIVAGSAGCRDIAFNGTYFYGGAASTTIFEMDLDNATMISTFTGPAASRGIAYNEDDDVFYCNNWSDDITQFDMAGANLGTFPVGPVGVSYYGFAYQSAALCGDGPFLWGYAQTGATNNELVQIELPSGIETGVYFDVGSLLPIPASAGGLCLHEGIVTGFHSLIGMSQNESIWGVEVCASGALPDDDLGVQSIVAPSSGLDLTATEQVTIAVKNYGNNTQTSFDVWFTLDGGSAINETVSTTLNAGDTYEHTFATTVDLSAYGFYDFEACVVMTGDENPDNDCKTKTVENYAPSLCIDGLYTSGCSFGDGVVYWDLADVNVPLIECDGPLYDWYHDFTDMTHNVEAGMDYDLTVQGGYNDTWVDVWVDWNDDLFMDDDELLVNDWELVDGGVNYTTTISIPADAPGGVHFLRSRTNWTSGVTGSCDVHIYGNLLDFTITTGGGAGGMATVYPFGIDYGTGSTDGVTKTETSMINAIGDVEKGWVKWDVSSIAAEATTIDSIRVWVYVNDANWPYWRITPLASDPLTADAVTIWDEVIAGQDDLLAYSINNESSSFGAGWHSYLLINNANADLEAALAQGWFGTGIGDTDGGSTYYLIIDGWNETNMPYMEVYFSGGGGTANCEDFDDLTVGGLVAEQLGGMWTTWSGTSADDATVSDTYSNSPDNSFVVDAGSVDLIFMFGDDPLDAGQWAYSHYNYVPAGFSGYFNVQSEPTPGIGWVVEIFFDDDGTGSFAGQASGDFTYAPDTWIMVDVFFDLDTDLGQIYFDGVMVNEFTNTMTIGGIDYFGANSGGDPFAYYDDVCFDEAGGTVLEPPTNLVAEVNLDDVSLTWEAPAGTGSDLTEIAYDDGTNEGTWWISGNPTSPDDMMALRLTMPEDGTIEEIAIFTRTGNTGDMNFSDIIVCDDDGTGLPDLGAAYENFGVQVISNTTMDWLELVLTSPFGLTAGEDFWIVANWTGGNTDGPFIGGDQTTPPTEDRNYWSNIPGEWNLWSGDWWMMRAYYSTAKDGYTGNGLQFIPSTNPRDLVMPVSSVVNPPAMTEMTKSWKAPIIITGTKDFTGYNVYRDGTMIDFTTDEDYMDMDLEPGFYDYFVTAVYDEGESEPSNTETVEVEEIISEECEDFDDLIVGGYVAEQLGGLWTTWTNNPGTPEDALVSDVVSLSPSNSCLIEGTTDLLQLFNTENFTSGVYEYNLNIYVPSNTTGYFNLQKDIVPGLEWGFQVMFEDDGLQYIDGNGAAAVLLPFDYDTWINCVMIVDLDNDWMQYYVDGALVHEYQWMLGTFGTPGAVTLGGANLYANPGAAGTPPGAHFDDLCFTDITPSPCEDFDELTVGDLVAETLGSPWNTWSGTSADDAPVSDDFANSAPNSFVVNDGGIDLIREFPGALDEGAHLYSHFMYVPSGFSGYFNVQSDPSPGVAWVIELFFDDDGTGSFVHDGTTNVFDYTQDTWFYVGINFDLDNDAGHVWFDDDLVYEFETTNTIGGIDYFGATGGGTPNGYYDDVCFEEGYEILPPAPPTDLEVVIATSGIDIDLAWNAPSGDKSAAVNSGSGLASPAGPVEMAQNINKDPILSDAQFDLLFNFAPAGVSEAGIETDGEFIYTSIWNGTGNFLKYDDTGNFIEEFTVAGAAGCRDIAYNGTYFYGGAASTTIFEMDFDAQSMVSTFTGPAASRAIAYNEVDDVFYCNNWSDDITQFDASGANLGSFPVGPVGASYYGFAFDNYSGGTYLWGYAQAGANTNELVQIDLPSGAETGLYFDVGSVIDPAGSGIAGGLCIDGMFVPDVYSIIGNMQGISLWGVELVGNTSLLGYNIYYSLDNGTFDLLEFTTETSYTHMDPGTGFHCYYVTAVYESGESDPTDTECETLIGIEDNLAALTQVYPNPATDVVTIKSDFTIQNIVVYNFSGQVVANEQVSNTNYTFDVAQFNPGVYIFQIYTDEGRLTKQIVIK